MPSETLQSLRFVALFRSTAVSTTLYPQRFIQQAAMNLNCSSTEAHHFESPEMSEDGTRTSPDLFSP